MYLMIFEILLKMRLMLFEAILSSIVHRTIFFSSSISSLVFLHSFVSTFLVPFVSSPLSVPSVVGPTDDDRTKQIPQFLDFFQ